MSRAPRATRVTTVLFLDIVGSTPLAAQLGDEGWRVALARFQQVVRADLKANQGREADTAGDGFFASFVQPASAIRCAASIVRDVRSLGIDVRCGIHSGELGTVDGKPGGMAVVVAARVMALGGPAEILCTATVRDLVMGFDVTFARRGVEEQLKGVPGSWEILTVKGAPDPLPAALTAEDSRARLAAVQPRRSRRGRYAVLGVASAVVIVIVVALVTSRASKGSLPPPPPSLLRIDVSSNKVVQRLGVRPDTHNEVLGAADGSLWQSEGDTLIRRRINNGGDQLTIHNVDQTFVPTFGFGSAWTMATGGGNTMFVTRYDAASGRATSITIPGTPMVMQWGNAFGAFVAGQKGVWYLNESNSRLSLIDPLNDRVRSWPTGRWGLFGPAELLPTPDSVWLCDPRDNLLKKFNPISHQVSKPIRTVGQTPCPIAVSAGSLWVLDRSGANTLTQLDVVTGKSLGVFAVAQAQSGFPGLTADAFGSLWFPDGRFVYRFEVKTHTSIAIPMPAGVLAGTVVADEPTRTVWVANAP